MFNLNVNLTLTLKLDNNPSDVNSGPADVIPDPADAGALTTGEGGFRQGVSVHGGAATEAAFGCSSQPAEGAYLPTPRTPLDGSSTGGSLRSAAGPGEFEKVLERVHKTVAEIFPENKIAVKCASCREIIPAHQGYSHRLIGDHRTYCLECHTGQGLPVREPVIES